MAPFVYSEHDNRFAGSIASLLARRGDIAARAAEQVGAINARAAEQSGQAWAGATSSIGQTLAGIPQQMEVAKRQGVVDQANALRLADAQQAHAGNAAVDSMMRGDQLPAGATGPRQESMLDANGLFDIGKMTQSLGASGMGHLAPDLLKGAEAINASIEKHQQTEAQLAKEHAILIGDLADGAKKLSTVGMPVDKAMDFVVQPALATKRITPEDYAKVKAQIAQLPPEQQMTALNGLIDQAAKLAPTKTLAEGAQETDRYGRTVATGAPKPKTEAELAADAANPASPTAAQSKAAMDLLKPQHRTESEQALDAYAQSIGKKSAGELTDADRQQYEQRRAKFTSDQAFTQHMRERQYDNAHPAPVRASDQNKLEQEYRTVLARAMSSRSGGIGGEDAKVQQANHLMALMDQYFDPKSGTHAIPRVQLNELALGLAKLTAGNSPAGEGMMREFQQRTAKGDLAGALTYLTGSPVDASTEGITSMLKESIERQGKVAEQNREGEMRYLRGLAPTDLEEPRRTALEANSLNPLRQSRVIKNTKSGERKLQTSLDGGKTWQ